MTPRCARYEGSGNLTCFSLELDPPADDISLGSTGLHIHAITIDAPDRTVCVDDENVMTPECTAEVSSSSRLPV
jgi:hypothetical protein